MDLMRLLKSLEEFLYEVMTWLVFYPLTFWRVLTRPSAMMAYSDDELGNAELDDYTETLSPPIFLALTLGLSHLLEMLLVRDLAVDGLLAKDENLIAFRLIVFSVYPLILAVHILVKKGVPLDRRTLRGPFYAQCFVVAPFALAIGLATILGRAIYGDGDRALYATLAMLLAASIWFVQLQARWFARQLDVGPVRAFGNAVLAFVEATALVIVAALVASLF